VFAARLSVMVEADCRTWVRGWLVVVFGRLSVVVCGRLPAPSGLS
jgi:hypothetical protein